MTLRKDGSGKRMGFDQMVFPNLQADSRTSRNLREIQQRKKERAKCHDEAASTVLLPSQVILLLKDLIPNAPISSSSHFSSHAGSMSIHFLREGFSPEGN